MTSWYSHFPEVVTHVSATQSQQQKHLAWSIQWRSHAVCCNPGIHRRATGCTINPKVPSGTVDFMIPFPDHNVGADQKLPHYAGGFCLETYLPEMVRTWRHYLFCSAVDFPGIKPWVIRPFVSNDTFHNMLIWQNPVSLYPPDSLKNPTNCAKSPNICVVCPRIDGFYRLL